MNVETIERQAAELEQEARYVAGLGAREVQPSKAAKHFRRAGELREERRALLAKLQRTLPLAGL